MFPCVVGKSILHDVIQWKDFMHANLRLLLQLKILKTCFLVESYTPLNVGSVFEPNQIFDIELQDRITDW